jgi:hypothetical protein
MSSPTTPPPPSKSNPPHRPIIHYDQQLVIDGVIVHAAVTNLAAAFMEQFGDDSELVGN